MHSDVTLLVLGVGGNVTQGILKALEISGLGCRVVGTCIRAQSIGLFTVDKAYVAPLAEQEGYLDWLIDLCRRERVRGILSGAEPILQTLARNTETILRETGATVLVSPPEILAIADDKLRTSGWLAEHGFDAPRSVAADDLDATRALARDCGYPLIAKPRTGRGASGIFLVNSESELDRARERSGYLVQEYLGDPDHEYTTATFSDRDGEVRGAIVLHRELLGGGTHRAEAGEFPTLRQQTIAIAAALKPLGPCNMQFRMRDQQPVCFELNVRFSGTAPIRARFGFNDVEAAVRHFILGQPASDMPIVTRGWVMRYWNELYADPEAVATLAERGVLERPAGYVEDYGVRR